MKKPTTGIRKNPAAASSRPVRMDPRATPASRRRRPGTSTLTTWAPPIRSVATPSTAHAVVEPSASAHTKIAAHASSAPGRTGTTTPTMPVAIARPTRTDPRSLTPIGFPLRARTGRSSGGRRFEQRRPGSAGRVWTRVLVLVVAPQPEDLLALLLAPQRRAVQQPVVAHHRLEAAGGAHVRPVHHPVRPDVGAEAGALRDVAGDVRPAGDRVLLDGRGDLSREERLQLVLRVQEAQVAVEVRAYGGDPSEAPAHPPLVVQQPLQRRARRADHRRVARSQ